MSAAAESPIQSYSVQGGATSLSAHLSHDKLKIQNRTRGPEATSSVCVLKSPWRVRIPIFKMFKPWVSEGKKEQQQRWLFFACPHPRNEVLCLCPGWLTSVIHVPWATCHLASREVLARDRGMGREREVRVCLPFLSCSSCPVALTSDPTLLALMSLLLLGPCRLRAVNAFLALTTRVCSLSLLHLVDPSESEAVSCQDPDTTVGNRSHQINMAPYTHFHLPGTFLH